MIIVYVYVLETLADWELGYITSELNSGRFFKKNAPQISLRTVSSSKDVIHTMGGLSILPDILIDEMIVNESNVLLLPGAMTWNDSKHHAIIDKANEFLSSGAMVCAICGATAALADFGVLDKRFHTSNGVGYLDMVSPTYCGQKYYIDKPSVVDHNLITASSTGALLWAKQIIEHIDAFAPDTLEYWYNYFSSGSPEQFYALMQSLPSDKS